MAATVTMTEKVTVIMMATAVVADIATTMARAIVSDSFLCHVVEGRLQLLEAEDARWLDRAHINDVNWLPADREVIKKM